MYSVFASVLGDEKATYIGTPITGGRRFFEWRRSVSTHDQIRPGDAEYEKLLRAHVVHPNLEAVRRTIMTLRRHVEGPLIDPSVVEVPRWSQEQYRNFWAGVIERFVKAVVLLDDWQYSRGCTHEWAVASMLGLPVYDERLQPLSPAVALATIRAAVEEIMAQGLDATFQRDIEASCKELLS